MSLSQVQKVKDVAQLIALLLPRDLRGMFENALPCCSRSISWGSQLPTLTDPRRAWHGEVPRERWWAG